jgi:hypothetical protein
VRCVLIRAKQDNGCIYDAADAYAAKRHLVRFLWLIGVLMLSQGAQAMGGRPEQLVIRIGGFMGPSYALEMQKEGVVTYSYTGRGKAKTSETIAVTSQQWEDFYQRLNHLGAHNWHESYMNMQSRDGTQWLVEITYPELRVKAQGSNAYPLEDGSSNDAPRVTPSFEAFLQAVRELTGREFH